MLNKMSHITNVNLVVRNKAKRALSSNLSIFITSLISLSLCIAFNIVYSPLEFATLCRILQINNTYKSLIYWALFWNVAR